MIHHRRQSEHGLSLVEISAVCVALVVMSAVIVESLRGLAASQNLVKDKMRAASLVERVAAMIENDAGRAMQLYTEDGASRAYLARMGLGDRTPLSGNRMPVLSPDASFGIDPPDAVYTGNVLFLGVRDGHALVDAADVGAPTDLLRVDVLRLVCWFPEAGPAGQPDLSRWTSAPMARLPDLMAITPVDRRTRLALGLYQQGVRYTWDPHEPAATAFRTIEPDGSTLLMPVDERLAGDPTETELGMFSRRNLIVARNGCVAAQVPAFARATATFPHGFETKISGDASGGLLIVRLVASTPEGPQQRIAAAEATRQIGFREE